MILLGVASDQRSALPDEIESRIEYVSHLRRISPLPGEDLRADRWTAWTGGYLV